MCPLRLQIRRPQHGYLRFRHIQHILAWQAVRDFRIFIDFVEIGYDKILIRGINRTRRLPLAVGPVAIGNRFDTGETHPLKTTYNATWAWDQLPVKQIPFEKDIENRPSAIFWTAGLEVLQYAPPA
jgi:hypothetical protein